MVAGGGLAARAVARRSTAIAMPVRGGRGSCTASGRWATLSAGMYDESGYIADYAELASRHGWPTTGQEGYEQELRAYVRHRRRLEESRRARAERDDTQSWPEFLAEGVLSLVGLALFYALSVLATIASGYLLYRWLGP
jgi:hypothetical protein